MSDLPMCSCAEFWSSHPPECPVRRTIERLRRRVRMQRQVTIDVEESYSKKIGRLQEQIEVLVEALHQEGVELADPWMQTPWIDAEAPPVQCPECGGMAHAAAQCDNMG